MSKFWQILSQDRNLTDSFKSSTASSRLFLHSPEFAISDCAFNFKRRYNPIFPDSAIFPSTNRQINFEISFLVSSSILSLSDKRSKIFGSTLNLCSSSDSNDSADLETRSIKSEFWVLSEKLRMTLSVSH